MPRLGRFAVSVALVSLLLAPRSTAQTPAPAQTPAAPSAEEKFASQLLAAKTDDEREALSKANEGLLNVRLRRALMAAGDGLENRGDHAGALDAYRLIRSIAEKIGDRAGVAAGLRGVGSVSINKGDYEEGLRYESEALALSRDAGDKEGVAAALGNIGNIYRVRGNYEQALQNYQQALALSRELGDKRRVLYNLNNMAVLQAVRGDYESALKFFQESLTISDETGDKQSAVATLSNIGNVYRHLGNYRLALEFYQKSLTLGEAIGRKIGVAATLNNIGNVYSFQGDYDLALDFYERSFALKVELGDKQGQSNSLSNIGKVLQHLGKYDEALEHLGRSLRLAEGVGDKEAIAAALQYTGDVYRERGDYARALDSTQRSLDISRGMGERQMVVAALGELASIYYEEKEYAKALDAASESARLAREMGEREDLEDSLATAGGAALALGRAESARASFAEAVNTVEAMRAEAGGGSVQQQQFLDAERLAPYRGMIGLLVSQDKPDEAFAYAERAKARLLLDVLESGGTGVTKAMTADERERERALDSRLAALNTRLARERAKEKPDASLVSSLEADTEKARIAREEFEAALYASHPELKIRRGGARPLGAEEAARFLPDAKTALLEYVVTGEKTFLFVLAKGGTRAEADLKVYTLPVAEKELSARAEGFRSQLAARDLGYRAAAAQLYDLLLRPAREQLKDKQTLVVVPDGALWQLPFQALQPAPNRYLLEDHAVFYAPSATVLREMTRLRGRNEGGAGLLAMANPSTGGRGEQAAAAADARAREEFAPLPEAEKEAAALARLYGPERSKVYVGADAREDRLKAEAARYGVIHLATHGVLDDASPMYSRLVLSQEGGGGEDGMLEAWEIMNLDLKADLAVLSACETARGRVAPGEGVIGLTWAFFVAGCPTTVVSQWKVDSASTTGLMLEFHRQLRTQGQGGVAVSKAEALRRASLKLMRDPRFSHPFYWASFVVVGDGF